jgi:steroid 5-alpha reductase family enzyme
MNDSMLMLAGPLVLVHACYLVAISKKDLSVIDIIWGLGFVVIAWIGSSLNQFSNHRENLLTVMVSLWGLRLAGFIYARNRGRPEDFRYAAWRKDWGDKVNLIAYFKVYLLQFALMTVVALPLFAVHLGEQRKWSWTDGLGLFVWFTGLLWEVIADQQKSTFKKNAQNSAEICQVGLWRLSRHPNYFGETLVWWGIFLVSVQSGNYWGFFGALFINFLLLKVSGVPLIEKKHEGNPAYEAYMKSTPRLIPALSKILK